MRQNRTPSGVGCPRVGVCLGLAFVVLLVFSVNARGEERKLLGYEELFPQKTLGGKQFWADLFFFHGWHIQRNAVTGHCRLLDADTKRHAWGTFDACRLKLDRIRKKQRLRPMRGRAVVLLHGLARSHDSMAAMGEYLREKGHYTIFNVSYPSTQLSIEEHAKNLATVLDSLEGIEEINFVCHSLGNIVVRRYLYGHLDAKTGQPADTRIRRMVMLGPPNHGSDVANTLSDNPLFKAGGKAGQELGAGWNVLSQKLVTPPFEFSVIAGGRRDDKGFNPFLRGDDDGIVRVESARLDGASDFTVVPVLHSFLMDNPRVQERALWFLTRKQRHRAVRP